MAGSPPGRDRPRAPYRRDLAGGMTQSSIVEELLGAQLAPGEVLRIVNTALDEDLGPQRLDVTSVATIPADQHDTGDLVARADGVVAGLAVAAMVFDVTSGGATAFQRRVTDGDRVTRGDVLATLSGPTRALL